MHCPRVALRHGNQLCHTRVPQEQGMCPLMMQTLHCPAVPSELLSLFAQGAPGMNQRANVPLCFCCSKQRQGTCAAKVSVSFRDFSEWECENQYQQPWQNFSLLSFARGGRVEVTQLNCAVQFNLLNEFAPQSEGFSFSFCSIFQRDEAICHRSHHRSRTVIWTQIFF